MKPALDYWKEVLGVSFRETAFFAWNKMLIGLAVSFLGFSLQWILGFRPWDDIWKILLTVFISYLLVMSAAFVGKVFVVPAQLKEKGEEERRQSLAKASDALKAKEAEIQQKAQELQDLKDRVFATPFSLRAEINKDAPLISMNASDTLIGGGPHREPIQVPQVVLRLWKRPQSQELEVTVTECRLQILGPASQQPFFSVRRVIRSEESIDISERLVKFVAGDPIERQRLLLFSQDVKAVLCFEVLSETGQTITCFRVNGKLNASTLQLDVEHLPNAPSSLSG